MEIPQAIAKMPFRRFNGKDEDWEVWSEQLEIVAEALDIKKIAGTAYFLLEGDALKVASGFNKVGGLDKDEGGDEGTLWFVVYQGV
ncbi:hypothetical protein Ciccas_014549 [Cichlidogyrus casuarinus]|uniref:Uncharacterized protein n=1 Tax=Cichlidogyrus casuarinus TaxID=1844966 RepID=A0ABD2PML5_9PLAT